MNKEAGFDFPVCQINDQANINTTNHMAEQSRYTDNSYKSF
jgi:hypothetical protein